jgi:hypothetical protein
MNSCPTKEEFMAARQQWWKAYIYWQTKFDEAEKKYTGYTNVKSSLADLSLKINNGFSDISDAASKLNSGGYEDDNGTLGGNRIFDIKRGLETCKEANDSLVKLCEEKITLYRNEMITAGKTRDDAKSNYVSIVNKYNECYGG